MTLRQTNSVVISFLHYCFVYFYIFVLFTHISKEFAVPAKKLQTALFATLDTFCEGRINQDNPYITRNIAPLSG